jgi:toxin-antitoxin system PIN domain toxin
MKPCLVDVNVWLALVYDRSSQHGSALGWYSELEPGNALFCRITQLGFLRLLTTKAVMGVDILSQDEAWAFYDRLHQDVRVGFCPEPPGLDVGFRRLTRGSSSSPKTWSDAYLAAFALRAGLTVTSFDSGFQRYPGLTWVRPGA